MSKVTRLTAVAVIMLVVLRVAIGWQLLYEGMWKIKTLNSPRPWTAAGYLKNAQGPLRDTFREMAGDPDELGWLDANVTAERWNRWRERFANHYNLSKKQNSRLNRLVNGSSEFTAALDELPASVDFKAARISQNAVKYDAEKKRLVCDGRLHLHPSERDRLIAQVAEDAPEFPAWKKAVSDLFKRSSDGMGYVEKLRATVAGDPDLKGNAKAQQVGAIDEYKTMLANFAKRRDSADQSFEWDHVNYTWGKIQAKRAELTGPVKALEQEMKDKALALLSVDQLSAGAVPEPWTALRISDYMTIAGLTILGALLVLGFFSRFAAFSAAVMLFMFYLAAPPWPGVPPAPGPEHSFIVNKNLIEVIALLGIAALPTGRWFGLDGLWGYLFSGRKQAG